MEYIWKKKGQTDKERDQLERGSLSEQAANENKL